MPGKGKGKVPLVNLNSQSSLKKLKDDKTPQLGGNLDTLDKRIFSSVWGYGVAIGARAISDIMGGVAESNSNSTNRRIQKTKISMMQNTLNGTEKSLQLVLHNTLALTVPVQTTWLIKAQILATEDESFNTSAWELSFVIQNTGSNTIIINKIKQNTDSYSSGDEIPSDDVLADEITNAYVKVGTSGDNLDIIVYNPKDAQTTYWHGDLHITEMKNSLINSPDGN